MLFDFIRNELYENTEKYIEETGLTEQSVLSQLKKGKLLHFKRSNIEKFIDNGTIQLTEIEKRKYICK